MSSPRDMPQRLRIDDLVLEPGSRRLFRGTAPIELPKLSYDLLLALAGQAPNVVMTDELMHVVWGDIVVSDETLTQRVKMLRDALGDTGEQQRYIETVRGVGYRLKPEVLETEAEQAHTGKHDVRQRRIAFTVLAVAVLALTLWLGGQLQDPALELSPQSIAVLPFSPMSDATADGYFADGLTEEILNSLAQIPDLLVTARTSAFFFKGRDIPIPEIGAQLGVAHVLEGSIRRDGEMMRITAQLIRTDNGFHEWSDVFEYASGDVFGVQIEIAERVAAALGVVLDEQQHQRMQSNGISDPAAFIAYQQAIELLDKAHGSTTMLADMAEANELFEIVIEREPTFSDAYLQHSDFFSHVILDLAAGRDLSDTGFENPEDVRLSLIADLSAAVRYARSDAQRVNAEFDRAMMTGDWAGIGGRVDSVVQHSDCAVPVWFDVVALPYGNARTTAPAIQREVTCNPLDFDARLHEFRTAVWLSEFENAYDVATEAYDTTGHPLFRPGRVVALLGQGRIDDARLMADAELVLPRSIAGARFWMAALRGDVNAARSLMDEYRSTFGFNAIDLIYFNVLLGDRDAANATAAAVDARPFGYMLLANAVLTCICGAPFDLEVTPNFARMVGQAGLSWPPETPINWPLKSW